jgi:hypothetical protein
VIIDDLTIDDLRSIEQSMTGRSMIVIASSGIGSA